MKTKRHAVRLLRSRRFNWLYKCDCDRSYLRTLRAGLMRAVGHIDAVLAGIPRWKGDVDYEATIKAPDDCAHCAWWTHRLEDDKGVGICSNECLLGLSTAQDFACNHFTSSTPKFPFLDNPLT